jgi:hypothetical protein
METISDFITDNNYERLLVTNSSSTDNLEAPIQDGGVYGWLLVPLVFLFFWNGFIGAFTTMIFSMLFRGKGDGGSLLCLLCPPLCFPWLLGICYPISIGYEALGVWGAFGFGFVDVILPYSCGLFITIYTTKTSEPSLAAAASVRLPNQMIPMKQMIWN